MEPRSQDGKSIDQDFAVTWLPKFQKADALRVKQTDNQVLGVVRMADRFGVRSETRHAAEVHARQRPEAGFLMVGARKEFLVGPMPYGADRASLVRAFKTLQWDIRPLQPVSSVPQKGNMWVVLAVKEPPHTLIQMAHGEVLVSKHKGQGRDAKPAQSKPVASITTIELCGAKDNKDLSDPWLTNDPWATKHPVPAAAPIPSYAVQQLEDKIQQSVLDKLAVAQGQTMDQDDVPDRVQQLEANVQMLIQQHTILESRVADSDRRQTSQLVTMQNQLNAQGQQLQGAIEAQAQNMGVMFESQMQQIRSLLTKRPRDGPEDGME